MIQGVLIGLAYVVVAASLFVLSWFYIVSVTWIFALWFYVQVLSEVLFAYKQSKAVSRPPDWCIGFDFINCICNYIVYESVYEKHNRFAYCRHLYDFIWAYCPV